MDARDRPASVNFLLTSGEYIVSGGADATVMVWNFKLQLRAFRHLARPAVLQRDRQPRRIVMLNVAREQAYLLRPLHQPGTSLSGGQQQRLCIARAIAVSPEVILMDEPCSALDPIATARIEELIDELSSQFTIVIVTHSMQQAARVSQRTAYFHLGKLVEVGETEQMFTTPQHEMTQNYITGRFG